MTTNSFPQGCLFHLFDSKNLNTELQIIRASLNTENRTLLGKEKKRNITNDTTDNQQSTQTGVVVITVPYLTVCHAEGSQHHQWKGEGKGTSTIHE